eukprot:gene11531-4784_t
MNYDSVKNRRNYKSANLRENFGETIKTYQTPGKANYGRMILNDLTNIHEQEYQKPSRPKHKPSPKFSIFDEEETTRRLTPKYSPNNSPLKKSTLAVDLSLSTLLEDEETKLRKQSKIQKQKFFVQPTPEEEQEDTSMEDLKSIILWENSNLTGIVFLTGVLFFTLIHLDYSPLSTFLNISIGCTFIGTFYSTCRSMYKHFSNFFKKAPKSKKFEDDEMTIQIDVENFARYSKFFARFTNDSMKFLSKIIKGDDLLTSFLGLVIMGTFSYLTIQYGWNSVMMTMWIFLFTYPLLTTPESIQKAHGFIFGALWYVFESVQIVVNKTIYIKSK